MTKPPPGFTFHSGSSATNRTKHTPIPPLDVNTHQQRRTLLTLKPSHLGHLSVTLFARLLNRLNNGHNRAAYLHGQGVVDARTRSDRYSRSCGRSAKHVATGWRLVDVHRSSIKCPRGWRAQSCRQCEDLTDANSLLASSVPFSKETIIIERLAGKPEDTAIEVWLREVAKDTILAPMRREEWITSAAPRCSGS
jgi:hypothetical protein